MGLFAQYAAKPQGGAATGNFFKDQMATNAAPVQPPAPQLGSGALGQFSGNAVRAVGGSIVRAAGVVDAGLDQTVGRGINIARGHGNRPTNSAATASSVASRIDAGADQTLAGKAGTVVGTVAPYLAGVGEETGAAAGAKVAAKTGSRVVGYVASRAPEALANTAIGTAQTGSVKKGAEAAAFNEVAAPVLGKIKGALNPSADRLAVKAAGESEAALSKIHDLISPKATAKEVKLAISEGRIAPGQEPGLLKGGTKDEILPSKQTERAAATITRHIPDAHTMKAPELYTALDSKVSQIAQALKPEMQKVRVSEQTVNILTDGWKALKAKQLDDPYMDATSNVEKLQAQFEVNFINKTKLNTLDDLWDTRKAYDASVPANVKDATSLSSDKLQTQKTIWLQNRGILNDAINDSSSGLGGTSRKAFSDMSDMYQAQKGIQSSYKLPKEGAPSKIRTLATSDAAKIAGSIVAGAGVVETGKRLATGQF